MKEIWKDILGYEKYYKISNYGYIKRIKKYNTTFINKILKPIIISQRGYYGVALSKNGIKKQFYIHRLVLETFIGPCPTNMECRHLDGNPENNRLDNLEWATHNVNMKDKIKHGTNFHPDNKGSKNGSAKLNDWKVRIINRLLEDGYLTQREIGKIFDVSRECISNIKNSGAWKHVKEN